MLLRLLDRRVDALFVANPDGVGKELALYRAASIPTLALVSRGAGCGDTPLINVAPEAAMVEASQRAASPGTGARRFSSRRSRYVLTLPAR